ncbi:hypothetical protein M427DRAFT_145688 [Gonapodya prolifera JEL478]|uniref:C2H2-type domain-containing protein n=1 Tax=Gonapodya prolifera (strain JEL478) TaxID=1344416 RepID=A0A139AFE6_GONPJ|nr:hypothetical protein M427DRAFT_145688 [Gonapodya prolifera JEL478]|eukprot:KXS15133.1 hypothetical protein M427DRAFT_145688 [Gonapodya prolifera JEL478]
MSSTSPTAIDPDDPRSLIQSPVLVLDKLSPWKTSQSSSPLNQAPTSHLRAIQDLHLEMDFDSAATSPTTAVVSPEDGFLQDQLPWVQSTEQAQTAPLSPTTAPFVKMEMNLNDTLGASQAAGLFKTIQPEVFHSNPMESSESSHLAFEFVQHPTPKFALVPLSVGVVESLNDSLRAARLAQFHDPSPTPPSINEDPMTLSRSSSAEISEQTSRLAIRGSNVRRQRRKEENTARVTSVLDKLTARRHSRSFSHVNPAYIGQDVDETASQLGAAPRNTLASSSSSPDLSVALSGDGTTSGTEEDDGTKVYPCTHCKKVFARISNLRAHESLHAGDRPHACPYCEAKTNALTVTRFHCKMLFTILFKRFTRSDGLNRHVMKQCGDSAEHRNVHTRHVSDGGRPWGRRDSLTQALQQTAAQNTVANVGVPLQTSVGPGTTGSVLPTAPLFLMPSYQQYVFAATQPSSMEPPLEWQAATHQQQIPLEISNMASTDAFQQQQPRFVYLTTFGQNPSVQTHIPTGNLSLLPEPMAEEFNHHLYSQNTYTTSQLSHE